jgi:hypothetical protein
MHSRDHDILERAVAAVWEQAANASSVIEGAMDAAWPLCDSQQVLIDLEGGQGGAGGRVRAPRGDGAEVAVVDEFRVI